MAYMIKTDLKVDWDWVKRSLIDKERIPPESGSAMIRSVDESIDKARSLAEPKAALVEKAVISSCDGSVKLRDGIELSGKTLSSYLKGARRVCLFLVTIGPSIEDEASELMKRGESLSGYLLDRAGAFAVESLANEAENYLRRELEPKLESVSMRFSPGYCDWPIEEQVKLNMLLDFSGAGVRLTENYMMIPMKSISGLMGIGPARLFSKTKSQCKICDMKSCGYRRT